MGGADVGGRRHGRDVSGHRDEDPGGRGARAGGCDVDDHRQLGVEHPLHDPAHRALEPTGRVELDDERLAALGLGPIDGQLDQPHGDGIDHPVDVDERHGRGLGRHRSGRDQREDETGECAGHAPHRRRAITLTSSNMRLAAISAVTCPGPSHWGATSTTSAPMMLSSASARTSTSAS